ncbi:MAG TPA: fused MFS/spermidine synthase [Verrucomicrobiae bacterium]|jgi:spermidine synthase|nr:fused MFS/spermidine synthase [Verrucomicrobiae bacterium]
MTVKTSAGVSARDSQLKKTILACFFISGICGLVYQVAWLRVLSLVFGNTTFATSTILSSYMAGLGLGALYFGNRIETSQKHPVRLYALLEGGVGVYAFLSPLLWKLIEWGAVGFYRTFEPSYLVFNIFKFVLAFAALFLPTFLMGGTLPLISQYFVRDREDTGRYVGLLYGLNTLGAVIGVLVSGFYAIYFIGVWQTVLLAGAMNLIIYAALKDFAAGETYAPPPAASAAGTGIPARSAWKQVLLILFGFSGAVSMMYELAWTRVLAIVLGSAVYSFTVMLATFLLGIALGSWIFSQVSKKINGDLALFSAMQVLTAVSVFWGINQFNEMPYAFVRTYAWAHDNPLAMEFGRFILCSRIMMLPTLFIGAMFTCFIEVTRSSDSLGRDVGGSYFANTIGTIFGAALTGFWILPAIGIQKTLFLGASINGLIGLITFLGHRPNLQPRRLAPFAVLFPALIASAVLVKPWNLTMISSDTAVKPGDVVHLSRQQFFGAFREREIIYYKDGLSGTVTVVSLKDNRSLAVNGKVDASNGDAFTQYLLGHLPMILHGPAEKALVIGLGSASTVAAVAAYPVKEIHAVELEKAVVEASSFFPDLNRDVLKDPRVKLFVNDGRNFLLVQPEPYDVIVSEPSNPWMAGVANLFSLEHFKNMSRHLKPGGIACQWLHAYSMSQSDLAMIIKTFSQGFPHVQLWTSYFPDLMLIGSNDPLVIDEEKIKKAFDEIPLVKQDLGPYGTQTPESLAGSFVLDDAQLREISKDAGVHTDNKPILEFSAPRNLYRQTLDKNYLFMEALRNFDYTPFKIDPPPAKNLYFYQQVARSLLSKRMYRDVAGALEKAKAIDPDSAENFLLAGILEYSMERPDSALVYLSEAAGRGLDSAELHYYKGLVLKKMNDADKALAELNQAVTLAPDETRFMKGLADTQFDLGHYQEALPLLEKVLAAKKHDFEVSNKITDIKLRLLDAPAKVEALQDMIRRYPRFPPSYLQLGILYEELHQLPEALEAYQTFTHFVPDQAGVYISMARVHDGLGQNGEMVAAMKKAVKLEPGLANNPQVQKILHG